jgi:hypothetical protein
MVSVLVSDGGDCGFDPGRVKPKTLQLIDDENKLPFDQKMRMFALF